MTKYSHNYSQKLEMASSDTDPKSPTRGIISGKSRWRDGSPKPQLAVFKFFLLAPAGRTGESKDIPDHRARRNWNAAETLHNNWPFFAHSTIGVKPTTRPADIIPELEHVSQPSW
jgi:hypothetical protein